MLKRILGILLLTIGLTGIAGVFYEFYLLALRKAHFTDKNYLKSQGLDGYLIQSSIGWVVLFFVAFILTPIGIRLLRPKKYETKEGWINELKKFKRY